MFKKSAKETREKGEKKQKKKKTIVRKKKKRERERGDQSRNSIKSRFQI